MTKRSAAIALLALLVLLPAAHAQSGPAQPVAASQCGSAEHRQFDFWLGDWDVYDVPDTTKVVARARISRMLGGCALREVYTQPDGMEGESFSLWDPTKGRWHQSWATNRGALLLLEGRFDGGRMVLVAPVWKPDGSSTQLRGTWWPEGRNVRLKAERSTDGGKRWGPVFDIVFRPRRPS
jgi:hypothetical protein